MAYEGLLADASTLVYLAKADAFEEAHTAVGTLLVPPAVWQEAVEAGIKIGVSDPKVILAARRAGWVRTVAIPSRVEKSAHELAERYRIGGGESQVLAMAKPATRVIVDDVRATRVAAALGYVPVPTVFVPILGRWERGLPRDSAVGMLRRLARVVALSAHQHAQLETLLGDAHEN